MESAAVRLGVKSPSRTSVVVGALLFVGSACSGGSPNPSLGETWSPATDAAGTDLNGTADQGPCMPDCKDKLCGPDGCGGSCGDCPVGEHCDPKFQCSPGECTPGQVKCVGDAVSFCQVADGGWSSPLPCEAGKVCLDGACEDPRPVCTPGQTACQDNAVVVCNVDGTAWGAPVPCPEGKECEGGQCKGAGATDCGKIFDCMLQYNCGLKTADCVAACFESAPQPAIDKAMALYLCMFDNCGKWGPGEACFKNMTITACAGVVGACTGDCQPACNGKQCGPDGCGSTCGQCPAGSACSAQGLCGCMPSCAGKNCGPDGCGGSCGQCAVNFTCTNGQCLAGSECKGIPYEGCCQGSTLYYCQNGKLITEDCGGQPLCGWNPQKHYYDCGTNGKPDPSGQVPMACPAVCTPQCAGKQCGSDGCGGQCGTCTGGAQCQNGLCVVPPVKVTCGKIVECVINCNWNQDCMYTCFEDADSEAEGMFWELSECIVDQCGWTISQQCLFGAIQGNCSDEYNDCLSDS